MRAAKRPVERARQPRPSQRDLRPGQLARSGLIALVEREGARAVADRCRIDGRPGEVGAFLDPIFRIEIRRQRRIRGRPAETWVDGPGYAN